jgi:LysR family hydrogen peroxide-inducible transcriptional activator
MELHQIRYFAAVARLNSFTKAAKECGVTQPTLSQQIAKLETDLGRVLFDRSGRIVRLSEAGKAFQDQAGRILAMVDDAKSSLAHDPETGSIVIAAIPTVGPYLLPQAIRRFQKTSPKARVEVLELTTAEILRSVEAGQLDLAVLALPASGESIETERLFHEELFLVLPAEHRLAKKKFLRIEDIAQDNLILLHDAHCLAGETMQFCSSHRVEPVSTSKLAQLATLLELVSLGLGISFVPAMAAKGDHDKRRVYRSLTGDKPGRTLAMIRNRHRHPGLLVERMKEAIRFLSATS